MGPTGRCVVQRGARRTMPSSSTTSIFFSLAPSDDGAAMSAESGGLAAAVWASLRAELARERAPADASTASAKPVFELK